MIVFVLLSVAMIMVLVNAKLDIQELIATFVMLDFMCQQLQMEKKHVKVIT